MGSVNRAPNEQATACAAEMAVAYLGWKSIADIGKEFGVPLSTVRARLLSSGVKLRTAVEGMTRTKREGRGISPLTGKYARTPEIIDKLRRSKIAQGDLHAKGTSKKPSGYVEFTRGPNKGRPVHDVVMEEATGHLVTKEFVVHHIDGVRDNNVSENLVLMTRAAHARLHALANLSKRARDALGRLI